MPIAPFAVKRLIPAGSNDPVIKPRIGILHVDAGNAESLYDYFRHRSGGIESHGFIKKNGVLEQYRDTHRQADANYRANDFATSWETQGFGEGKWTEEQLAMIKRVIMWEHKADNIPLRIVKSWDDPKGGWGYHTLFGAPSNWTPVAKSCPGNQRKEQFHDILVPWMRNGGGIEKEHPTPNITDALKAKTVKERKAALRRVIRRGDDKAANIAARWLDAINAAEDARELAQELRVDLRQLEVKV